MNCYVVRNFINKIFFIYQLSKYDADLLESYNIEKECYIRQNECYNIQNECYIIENEFYIIKNEIYKKY